MKLLVRLSRALSSRRSAEGESNTGERQLTGQHGHARPLGSTDFQSGCSKLTKPVISKENFA